MKKLEASRDARGFSQDAFDDYGYRGAWKLQQRKHNQTRLEKETLPEAFVLVVKPRINVALTTVSSMDLHRNFVTATSAAVNTRTFTYALQPASNTIRLLVYDTRQADGFLKLSQLDVNRGKMPVQVYQAPGRDMCRGVIYNVDCNKTKTDLRAALTFEHRRILDAGPMGKHNDCQNAGSKRIYAAAGEGTCGLSLQRKLSCECTAHKGQSRVEIRDAVCPTCGKTHEGSSAGDECEETTLKCRNCEEEGHTATDPKCPAKLKSDANLAKKIRSRSRSRCKRHGVHRSRSLRTTVQPHDVKSTRHRLEDENVSTQPRTLKEAVNEIVSKNCTQPTARGSGSNLSYAAALKQTRPNASKPANVSHCTTPMPPSPSQLVGPSKDSVEDKVAELARQNAELRRKLEENEKRNAALLERLRSKRQQQPCNPQEPTKSQKPASTTITQQTELALLVQQILHPLLQTEEQHFQRQYGLLQQLFASPALHSGQRNTTPDLTLSTPDYVKDWQCDPDTWGIDHYPLCITLNTGRKCAVGHTVRMIRWDSYRRAFAEQPNTGSVRERALHALRMATTETENARKRAQLTYVENGRRHRDRVRLRRRTAVARRYAKRLYRERWSQHCSSFNERTSLHKVWYTFKVMTVTEEGHHAPFSLFELERALSSINARNAPGHAGMTWAALRNLEEYAKKQPLDEINAVSVNGEIPAGWKHSIVTPIPKPNKQPDVLSNMRPVSFSLTTCKLAERMALTHTSHFLETEGRFHPAQTGFRPNLGTHDSLLLVKEGVLRRKTVGRGNRHPSILVAVDLRKAFDTVTHEAIIEAAERHGITGRPFNFVRSFLQDRTFSVRVDGDVGKKYQTTCAAENKTP
ncbi:hypothetical protein HPB49_008362 [Dermacentor silvarum]|uniref:Uncharacterized protein n=1 Tax=Dermacentor silvarum TaxID=543639 RepID=A0ACB8DBE1_DERSI|nr:hypothetical protein HPB49_008362 [Dermacentor silvarum]